MHMSEVNRRINYRVMFCSFGFPFQQSQVHLKVLGQLKKARLVPSRFVKGGWFRQGWVQLEVFFFFYIFLILEIDSQKTTTGGRKVNLLSAKSIQSNLPMWVLRVPKIGLMSLPTVLLMPLAFLLEFSNNMLFKREGGGNKPVRSQRRGICIPLSQKKARRVEQPGPPVSQSISGSSGGDLCDSTKQQNSCTSSVSPTAMYLISATREVHVVKPHLNQ